MYEDIYDASCYADISVSRYLDITCSSHDRPLFFKYSQTSLIRASLIRMPHNPNKVSGNLFYRFLFTMIQ